MATPSPETKKPKTQHWWLDPPVRDMPWEGCEPLMAYFNPWKKAWSTLTFPGGKRGSAGLLMLPSERMDVVGARALNEL